MMNSTGRDLHNDDTSHARNSYALQDIEVGRSENEAQGDHGTMSDERAGSKHGTTHGTDTGIRHGFNPAKAVVIVMKSSCRLSAAANFLWPLVPVGLALHWAKPDWYLPIFITNYLSMIASANTLAFTSGELAKKIPVVLGVLLGTTMGAAVEIILCLVILFSDNKYKFEVIQAALIGSMLANLLLCTGLCFIVGGIRFHHSHQSFDETVTEVGGGMLLISVGALMMPLAFATSVTDAYNITLANINDRVLHISHLTAICLIIAYAIYVFFQLTTHHSIFETMLEKSEHKNKDRRDELRREKLTTSEAILFAAISLALVTMHAIFMVEKIEDIVEHRHVSDAFIGLILVPLVEKAAEHLTAIDEAFDDSMDFALSHILGATVQTSLMVAPLVVIVAWIAGEALTLNFELFMVVLLVVSVLVVQNFIKDNKSNYLEGALCIIFYVIIAGGTWFYPNPAQRIEEA